MSVSSEQNSTGQEREPQLKYSQLDGDASVLLGRDEATAFRASDKLHVLGCASGSVHVLDFEGHRVRSCRSQPPCSRLAHGRS